MASKIRLIQEAFRHKGFMQKLPDLYRMLKTMSKGAYKPNIAGLILPGLALIYIISPIDVIPDWIPILGQMDDLAVLALALPLIMKEVEKFIVWEAEVKENVNPNVKTIDVDAN